MARRIAVVEHDGLLRRSLVQALASTDSEVDEFGTGGSFLERIGRAPREPAPWTMVLMGFRLPDMDGVDVLRRLRQADDELPVVMMAGFGDLPQAQMATDAGASEVVQAPLGADSIQALYLRHARPGEPESQRLRMEDELGPRVGDAVLVGRSEKMRSLMDSIRRVAASEVRAVLIRGETGTGKELVARLVHELSPRCEHPFVPINSGAVMPSLLESEMFGYEKGAFTGAQPGGQRGRIEYADGGTVFLDEVGDMDPALQVKLLRTLETGEVRPVGSNELRHVDVRFVAATHQDMKRLVREGRFRRDLFHRLSVVILKVPPLRKRGDDILLLAEYFLEQFSRDIDRDPPRLGVGARVWLSRHPWSGNVRELRNMMERVALLSRGTVLAEDLFTMEGGLDSMSGEEFSRISRVSLQATAPGPAAPAGGVLHIDGMTMAEVERATIERAMERADGNVAEAARLLGIGYGALRHRLAKL